MRRFRCALIFCLLPAVLLTACAAGQAPSDPAPPPTPSLEPAPAATPAPGPPDAAVADVANHWAYTQGYLQTAVELGILSGYNAQTFGPNDPLTRAQLIKIAAAALGLTESGSATSYTGVPSWAKGWVAAAEQAGLIGARAPHPIWTSGDLNGDAPVTRAEAATVLANLLALKQ